MKKCNSNQQVVDFKADLIIYLKDFFNQKSSNFSISKYLNCFLLIPYSLIFKYFNFQKIKKNDLFTNYIKLNNLNIKFANTFILRIIFYFKKIVGKYLSYLIFCLFFNEYKSKIISFNNCINKKNIYKTFKDLVNSNIDNIIKINALYIDISNRLKNIKKIFNKASNMIAELNVNKNDDRKKEVSLVEKLNTLNLEHQKLFYSSYYKDILDYYLNCLIKLDKWIKSKSNVFNNGVDFGYLNLYLNKNQYELDTKNNIYKKQLNYCYILLKDISNMMKRFGLKTTYSNNKKAITIETVHNKKFQFN